MLEARGAPEQLGTLLRPPGAPSNPLDGQNQEEHLQVTILHPKVASLPSVRYVPSQGNKGITVKN